MHGVSSLSSQSYLPSTAIQHSGGMSNGKDENGVFEDDSAVHSLGVLQERSAAYKSWLIGQLKQRDCRRVLDVACGTGSDSLFLLDEGMEMVSCDIADGMLKHAMSERSRRSAEPHIAKWVILKANWLTLTQDLTGYGGFDAVICLGNSMIGMVDPDPNLDTYRQCIVNFKSMLKPGGLLLIDHRNMDAVLDHGTPVNRNAYFKENTIHKIGGELIRDEGKSDVFQIVFHMVVSADQNANGVIESENGLPPGKAIQIVSYPMTAVRAKQFGGVLQDVFGENSTHSLYGDLQPFNEIPKPAYFQHAVYNKTGNVELA